jgi:hypothetical protein
MKRVTTRPQNCHPRRDPGAVPGVVVQTWLRHQQIQNTDIDGGGLSRPMNARTCSSAHSHDEWFHDMHSMVLTAACRWSSW